MSVPVEHIAAGRYYRTSIGQKPCVVKVEYESLGRFMCRVVAPEGARGRKLMTAARLFHEVVQAGDGSGRWAIFDRARHEAKSTSD